MVFFRLESRSGSGSGSGSGFYSWQVRVRVLVRIFTIFESGSGSEFYQASTGPGSDFINFESGSVLYQACAGPGPLPDFTYAPFGCLNNHSWDLVCNDI